MQLKTINKIVREKMVDWLSTIPEENDLRKRVKDSLLVSGGAIASLFTKEPVNDYDVYIQDMDVLYDLVKFYCDQHGIPVYDGRKKDTYIKNYISGQKNEDSEYSQKMFEENNALEAVRIRTLKDDQIKISADHGGIPIEDHQHIASKDEPDARYLPLFFSPNAISLSDDVQIVCRFSGTPEEIHKNYDFIHATNYFTMKDGVVTNEPALVSLLTRQLKYQGSLYPVTSIIRIKKFTGRGYNITAGEILKILYQVSKLDLEDVDVLHDQLIGVDIAYFSTLIKILREASPEQQRSEQFLFAMIDKVFGE